MAFAAAIVALHPVSFALLSIALACTLSMVTRVLRSRLWAISCHVAFLPAIVAFPFALALATSAALTSKGSYVHGNRTIIDCLHTLVICDTATASLSTSHEVYLSECKSKCSRSGPSSSPLSKKPILKFKLKVSPLRCS